MDNTGAELSCFGSQDLQSAIDTINSDVDLKVFIANNRTGNPPIRREEFQPAPDLQVLGKSIRMDTLHTMKQELTKRKLLAPIGEEDDGSSSSRKRQGRVERALMAAWGSSVAADDDDEDAEKARELAIHEELQVQKVIMRDQLQMLLRGQQCIDADTKQVIMNQL